MADDSKSKMTESALKETLCAQQQLLQKLHNELDAEREASSTAASEALSVIVRLQGEKAAIKMESEQYKRFSEEKMCHAEESLAIIQDIIYQKEMEAAALDHQVQAYRCRLLSMGCVDVGLGDLKFSDNFLAKSKSLGGETSVRKLSFERSGSVEAEEQHEIGQDTVVDDDDGDRVASTERKISANLPSADIDSYWDQIVKLGVRVKEIAGGNPGNPWIETGSVSSVSSQLSGGNNKSNNNNNVTRSPSPQINFCSPCDATSVATFNETEKTSCSSRAPKHVASGDYPTSPSIVHDVFEVPRADPSCGLSESSAMKSESKRQVLHPEAIRVNYSFSKEIKPEGMRKKAWKPSQRKRRVLKQNVDQLKATMAEVSRLQRTSEIVEVESSNNNHDEEIKLLKEIKEEINVLRQEVKSLAMKKATVVSTRKEAVAELVSLESLQEAMPYFWA